MNCCDYGCNQGRNCPARKSPVVEKPMPIEYIPRWRDHFPDLLRAVLFVSIAAAAGVSFVYIAVEFV